MKGIISGAQYTFNIDLFNSYVSNSVTRQNLSIWGKEIISCEFWYALIVLTANLAIFFALMIQDEEKRWFAAQ